MRTPYFERLARVSHELRAAQEADEIVNQIDDIMVFVQDDNYLAAAKGFLNLPREIRTRLGVPPMHRLEDVGGHGGMS